MEKETKELHLTTQEFTLLAIALGYYVGDMREDLEAHMTASDYAEWTRVVAELYRKLGRAADGKTN